MRRVGATTVAIIGAPGPVTTIAFGWLGLEEVMTPLQLANAVLVDVVVISLGPAPPAKIQQGVPSFRVNRRPCGVACPAMSSSG